MADDIFFDDISQLYGDEELFARDSEGQLMRVAKVSDADYEKKFEVIIDGEPIEVRKAVPATDSQGVNLVDEEGNTLFRRTTIWDAAQKRYVRELGGINPIPTLCHQEHLKPAAVCRICTVQTFRVNHGIRSAYGKLLPACFQPCELDMEVHTVASPSTEIADRVKKSISLLGEMLRVDHLRDDFDRSVPNELATLTERFPAPSLSFSSERPVQRNQDHSSTLIRVDHDSCILCDRCVRSCSDVKENFVIGRMGKGYTTRIAFDFDTQMGDSSCVSCGECMINCPTDALTFREQVHSDWWNEKVEGGSLPVSAEELAGIPLFQAVSYKFLQWNSGAVVRRMLKKGDVLCRQGDYGATAFILVQGDIDIYIGKLRKRSLKSKGIFGNILARFSGDTDRNDPGYDISPGPFGELVATRGPEDLILGEMTCMSFYPRNATLVAREDGEVLEVRRNVLYMLQRNAVSRKVLDRVYRERALQAHLSSVAFFEDLTDEEREASVEFLKNKVSLVRLDPGQAIFHEGERADAFYMIRIGHVKVFRTIRNQERILNYLRPNSYFGEIGLVSESITGLPQKVLGRRTATCVALDDVEVVKISANVFEKLTSMNPSLKKKVIEISKERLYQDQGRLLRPAMAPLPELLDQGLFNGQKLLVLDLEACTRCDECSKACADTHGGITRLVREGLRFDQYLIASACRSCTDPYCLVGCPVDAIHREGALHIAIEDHCIGCGQCAKNCPYGNINMVGFPAVEDDHLSERAVVRQRATTCDLCQSVPAVKNQEDAEVSCVYACPHDAAFRWSGDELCEKVMERHSSDTERSTS